MCQAMVAKLTSTRPRTDAAFTLPELMVASALGVLTLLMVAVLSTYSSRSFVASANYVSMDQQSQLALDKMSREIRQALRLTDFSPTSLTFEDADNKPLMFHYDSEARTLVRTGGGETNTYLTDCDFLQFSKYQ